MQNLEKLLFDSVELNTPEDIKKYNFFDIKNKNEFTFLLTREIVEKYKLWDWFKNYKKEALVSTAGIRGAQNILYPHDTRFPINTIGIMLATVAKALVLIEKYPNSDIIKLVGREVRYNSAIYLDIISRLQAALGIKTLIPIEKNTIPIWLASFLAYKLDLLGGEYITSSHGISVKNATKDLNNQGSQFLPQESMEFVEKMEEILNTATNEGRYEIKFAATNNKNLDFSIMEQIENGINLYIEYLITGVANKKNIELIKNYKNKIVIDSVGGCAYKTLSKILEKLGISNNYIWFNTEEDPFFHSIGKDMKKNANGEDVFYDWSLDIGVSTSGKDGKSCFPVIKSLNYDEKLKNLPTGTVILVTDPDHDRLSVLQTDDIKYKDSIIAAGIDIFELSDDKILTIYSPNQAFLMIMDFWAKSLVYNSEFSNHSRFVVKTTPSSRAWDEWAKAKGIQVINTPVGFKEIANAVKKIEQQIDKGIKDIKILDIYNNEIHLGASPRMIFGGEESGGMILGAEEPIKSFGGRSALAMREKSASEAIIVASALVASLDKPLWQHLTEIYNENNIIFRFDTREDISYYNESEPNIEKLKEEKAKGEIKRSKNDLYFLALALALYKKKININEAREILSSAFPKLNFSNLENIYFVGDGSYLQFSDKFVEIRPSGTDAKTKAYAGGLKRDELFEYAKALGNFSGEFNETFKKYLDENFLKSIREDALKLYGEFVQKDEDKRVFKPVSFEYLNEKIKKL